MMQEEEIDIRYGDGDDIQIREPMQNFSIIDSSDSQKYIHSNLEIFVAVIVTLGTFSGGFMEGYSSPAVSSMLTFQNPETFQNTTKNFTIPLNYTEPSIAVGENTTFNSTSHYEMNPEASFNDSLDITTTIIPDFDTTSDSLVNGTLYSLSLANPFQINEEQASWFGSLLLLGACAGACISSYVVSLGRKNAILISSIPRLTGWLLITFSSSLVALYSGRFLCGFSIGFVTSAAPIYISEVSQPKLRGSLSCLVQLGVNLGIFFVVLLGTAMSWRWLAGIGVVTVILYAIPTFFLPTSPAFLVVKGRDKEARNVLRKLRCNPVHVEEEMQEIIKSSDSKRKTKLKWSQLFSERRCRIPLYVVLLVTCINRFSGYNALIMYCSTFLHQAAPTLSHYWAAVAVCFIQVLMTAASLPLVESWGRRKLLMSSVLVMGTSLITIAIYDAFKGDSGYTWIAVTAAMVYVGAYSVGIGPLTWVLLGEMFPLDAREKASAVVSVCNWLAAFIVTKTFFWLEGFVGISGTCVVYASVCIIGVVLMYWFVPETKSCSLAEIELHFTYSQSTWKPFKRKIDQALSGILDQEVTVDSYSTFQ